MFDMARKSGHNTLLILIIIGLLYIIGLLLTSKCDSNAVEMFGGGNTEEKIYMDRNNQEKKPKFSMVRKESSSGQELEYGRDMPLIFIGGVPRSGTTLMRAMLDAHPLVRCGEETRIIPRILGMGAPRMRSKVEAKGFSINYVTVIVKHGAPAPRLCNKDPFTLKNTVYLNKLFPNAKYILMIRDGRATIHSVISRKVTIGGFDLKNPRQCLTQWNNAIKTMYKQCYDVGEKRCFPMYYEQLILHPEKWMRRLLKFLDLPFNSSVLNHEAFIGQKISLSKVEPSTSQVIKPVNTDALTKWVGKFPEDVIRDMPQIAPMLEHLGYDPTANPPNYGQADSFVKKKTEHLHNNEEQWNEKAKQFVQTLPPMNYRRRNKEKGQL